MTGTDNERREILESLISGMTPIQAAATALSEFPWDSEHELASVSLTNIAHAIRRYEDGEIRAEDLSTWADFVSDRDDIAYGPDHEALVSELLFELATPELFGPLEEVIANASRRLNF